jgi:hypothetical protein
VTLPEGLVQPQAVVTLKVADDGDRVIWTEESRETVHGLVNGAQTRLITLTRVKGMKGSLFSTRPDNVANVEAI